MKSTKIRIGLQKKIIIFVSAATLLMVSVIMIIDTVSLQNSVKQAYRDIKVIEKSRNGLEEIIKSAPTLFELQSMKKFASGVLTQLISIVNAHENAVHCSFAVTKGVEDIYILAASGDFALTGEKRARDVVPVDVLASIKHAFQRKESHYGFSHLDEFLEIKDKYTEQRTGENKV